MEKARAKSPAQTRAPLAAMLGAMESPMLIAVGGGVGDMLHTTPMIRNISRRLGTRVDILVSEEYPKNLFLLHNPEYVNAVYALRQASLARTYDTIFVTHFFGEARVPLRGHNVVWSRTLDKFRVGAMHETIFNLETARELLGIFYDERDSTEYFVGDFAYTPPREALIGFHAGCKTGHWLSKRWPYFQELAAQLRKRGLRVASFGTAEEYVEGTENRTGGTIKEMCEGMLDCSFFIANDSGVMNIANALGIPLLGIFGPTDAKTLLPLRSTSAAIALEKICAPCHMKNPKRFAAGECSCIGDIPLEGVVQRLDEVLQGPPRERIVFVREHRR
jgi:ADP-heptose:LPS heptosyltransferase